MNKYFCGNYSWKKMKDRDIFHVENMLCDWENDYVNACGRFLSRVPSRDCVWALQHQQFPGFKKIPAETKRFSALIINSRSTLMPVLCGLEEIPAPRFLKSFFRTKKIHSVQGLKNEVMILENAIEKMGRKIIDVFDYDLMALDDLPLGTDRPCPENLVLRAPKMIDLDKAAPLQAGYEKEEVLHRGSVFSPASSRVNLANIIAKGQILTAELNGIMVGKINVSTFSFNRCQIGGVYIHPDFRGMGIARRMTKEFIVPFINQGKGITLFVKKNNIPAQKLYSGLGFKKVRDYRITYY
ncbi:MAG: GNAT family N-acetyltransferase [Treponema sp.]|jgi:ribosomal protein S18 acetylase RimI-like enzyme|nr:GNAT family N-acetyltransferase [Treponema sp.]